MPENTQTLAAGGALTQEVVAQLLLQPLQAQSIFLAAGVRLFDTNGGNSLRIPTLTGSTGAGFVAEGAQIPDDDVSFGELKLLPTGMDSVKVITRVSEEMLRQSTVALDQVLRTRLVGDVAAALDRELIAGTDTTGTRPLGLLNYAGTQKIAAGAAASFDMLLDMEAALIAANVDPAGAQWLIPPFVFAALRKLKDTTNSYLLQPDITAGGTFSLFGHPVTVTSRIPTTGTTTKTTSVVLYKPSLIAVARDIAPTVQLLTERYADTGQVGVKVQCRYDSAPMFPQSVVIATGVTGG